MDIKNEINEILERKGVTPPHMTDEEFTDEFRKRLENKLFPTLNIISNRIIRDIIREERKRIGRDLPCRYELSDSKKHCGKDHNCLECYNYKPRNILWRKLCTPLAILIFKLAFITFGYVMFFFLDYRGLILFSSWYVFIIITLIGDYLVNKKLEKVKQEFGMDP